MIVVWNAAQPAACDEHGPLAGRPLPALDGWIVMLEHLRDVHGRNVTRALESLASRRIGERRAHEQG